MKSIGLLLVVMLLAFTTVSAKKLPTVAAKLPSNLKEVIANELNYPRNAVNDMVEGEVWLKICVSEESTVKVVDISATDENLGEYVKKELSTLYVENPGCQAGEVFYLKVKFDLLNK